jgi:hypothetical protein
MARDALHRALKVPQVLTGEAEERWCECVADRERERISRVGGRRRRGESEQCLRQPLHLLVGPAVAADGLLDLRRRVLDTGKARLRTGHEERASDLPDRERAPRIEADERLLERDRVRPVLGEQRLKGQEQPHSRSSIRGRPGPQPP